MIPVSKAHLLTFAATNPGRKGKNNEDRYGVSAYLVSKEKPTPALLAIVADGIGGHRAGEIAAEMAVENISRMIAASDAVDPVMTIQQAFIQTSQAIYARSQSDPGLEGMGTTCACCWVIGDRLYAATVGDSRIYLARGASIRQLSVDHTWIQEAIDLGALSEDRAQSHPNMHIIRRFLGSRETAQPDLRLRLTNVEDTVRAEANQGMLLYPGDRLLLCTDGLTDLVKQDEISLTLHHENGQAAVERLIELANQRGGHDNITAVLLQVPKTPSTNPRPSSRRKFFLGCVTLLILLILLGGILGGAWLWNRRENREPGLPTKTTAGEITSTPHSPAAMETNGPVRLTASPYLDATLQPDQTEIPAGVELSGPTLTPWPTNTP